MSERCPDNLDLALLAEHVLRGTRADALLLHLAGCASCQLRLRELDENLRIADLLRDLRRVTDV